ncbi:AMP-binding enzyme family protein [Mycobacterium xenopi 4042]|uniref:AMP-binding enzyme family protein n=1 Tax=Mycobacterium xenopi 4042 TaxID=1299334 RepID=X8AMW6_MYCXE|nr:AMP-binding enzyme family protein [Mycobacterium xenopi 4042]
MWTQCHSFSFDFSVWEVFGALLHGRRLLVVPDEVTSSPQDFHDLLVAEHVDVVNQTPSALGVLSPTGWNPWRCWSVGRPARLTWWTAGRPGG